jgi:hypothetical protein
VYLSSNWMSRAGVVLVTTAAALWIVLLPVTGAESSLPYFGIVPFLALPICFFLGLLLIPIGIIRRWRASAAEGRIRRNSSRWTLRTLNYGGC